MRPEARVQAGIELLGEVLASERPADAVVSAYFRTRRYIGSKDRAEIAERIYATLRHHARLGWWLARAEAGDGARERMIAELLLAEGLGKGKLETLFGGGQYAPASLDQAERRLAGALASHTLDHPEMPAAVRGECPDWAAEPLARTFGDRLDRELAALLEAAPLDLRVNEAKAERPAVLEALVAGGIEAEATPISPLGIRVRGRPPLAGTALFKEGAIEVQDEGSQVVALLVDARPGMQVADFCAGAGGKALALGGRMAGKGRVVASDVSEGRLKRARERLRRAGLDNVEPKLLVSERDRWVKRQKGKFDRVLVDAPCTGVGAWRRNPDARWRPMDLAALTAQQAAILASAARLTKPGGRLVYATCSLLPDENQDQVARFLGEHPDFAPLPIERVWAETLGGSCPASGDSLLLTPARNGTDGFFVAVMERRELP